VRVVAFVLRPALIVLLLLLGGALAAGLVFFFITRAQVRARAAAERSTDELRRAADSLRASETRFRTLIEQSPLSTQIFSPDGLTVQVNRAWENLWGVTLEQIAGYNILEDQQLETKGILPFIRKAFAGEASLVPPILYDPSETIPHLTSNKEACRWVQAFIYPVKDEAGRIREVVLVHEDITERKRAEENLRYQLNLTSAITDNAAEGLCMIDGQGLLTFMNPAARRILGWRESELMGRSVHERVHYKYPDGRPYPVSECPLTNVVRGGTAIQNREDVWIRKDGTMFPVYCSCVPIMVDGRVTGAVLAFHDITERRQAQQALQESEAKLRLFIENAPAAIAMFDREMRYVVVSRRWLIDNDLEGRGIIGKSHYEVVPDLPAHWREGHRRALAGAIERAEEEQYRKPDGTVEWIRWEVRPWGNAHGEISGVIIFTEKITDRKRAEEALQIAERRALNEYEALLERLVPLAQALGTARDLRTIYRALLDFTCVSMPCAGLFISLYDAQRDVRTAAFGWGDGVELDVSHLPPMPILTGPNSRAVRTGEIIITDDYPSAKRGHPGYVVGEDNGLRPASSLAAPMTVMGRIVGTIEVQSYEPSAYRKEHATAMGMAANFAAVAIENVRLFELESSARAEAEAANRLKDEFLTTLSHELRTPLTSILGWASLMKSASFDTRMTSRAVQTIERNARAQTQLIDDLLDVSRIITGKLRLNVRPIDLAPIIESAADSARPAAEAKELSVRVLLDPSASPVLGDPDRLQQIVWNLLSNAIKFTPKGGRVEASLRRVENNAEISVKDTGQGISAEFLPYVFDRFRQADGRITRVHGGLGLGLAIVRHLVELHGGAIHVESAGENQGATFRLRLPLLVARDEEERGATRPDAINAAAASRGVLEGCASLAGLRVLVVDDDRDTRELLSTLLQQCGARVTLAPAAPQALEALRQAAPDVLLFDIGLPNEDGYELIRRVRALPAAGGGQTPAAALTAYAAAEDRERAIASGYQAHIPKPIDAAELTAVIARLAGRIKT
jgi:PAS domain S-box-containing protein